MQIAKHHEVHVIVEKYEFEEKVMRYIEAHPEEVKNMSFHFIPREHHEVLRKIWPPSYYWFYKVWMRKAYALAKVLDVQHDFDLAHQITIAGYRQPGYLWKLGKPYVWGPVGGHTNSPWCLLRSLGMRGFLHFNARNIINEIQKRWGLPSRAAAKHAHTILTSNSTAQREILAYWGRETTFMSEIGCDANAQVPNPTEHKQGEPLKICWVGETVMGKAANILLEALTLCEQPMELHAYGRGARLETWRKMARDMGLEDRVTFHGFVPQEEVWAMMRQSHVLCITSIRDDTSAVVLEAFRYALPVIALDYTGFRDAITADCGIKISTINKKQIVKDYARHLDALALDEVERRRLSAGALERSRDYTWDAKMVILNKIYSEACPESRHGT